ncbi:MAG TPA: HAMP domain-containing sensor histidine kinase [Acidimicrobiia bacterium]|nr:HAMP domain-containing sensor histidine kinase [Acidimicrobiia bacterium]
MIALLLAGALAAWLLPEAAPYIGFFGLLVGLATVAVLFLKRSALLDRHERKAWRLIALAVALFWAGVLAVAGLTELGYSLPAFGPIDAFFLGGYVAMIMALYQLARVDSGGREWVLTLVDALVGGIALAALVWNAFFHDLMESLSGAPWWETTIAATYPVVDIMVVVGLLILVLRRSNYRFDLRLVFFALGGGIQVSADFLYLSSSVGVDFTAAEPAYPVNLLATVFLLVTAAMVDRVPKKREFAEAPTPIWAIMWPYLLAVGLVGVYLQTYRALDPGSDEVLLLDAVILIGIVIFLRQVYVIHRDRHRVDRKRAELVASVSHELRTPLTAMVGFLSLLDDHAEEFPVDARQEMIAEAAEQARHMSRLVSDLLMLAKGDTRGFSLEIREVRAISVVMSVLRNTEVAGTRIEQDLDADVLVRLDPDRMKQALVNLLTNALRYGGDRCLVVAKVSGRDLVFEVHDNGGGVPTRYQSLIWQHFERGAHRLDASTPGLGIGLSIVQTVTESHGGRADYRVSERLGGACFSVTIPGCVVDEVVSEDKVPAAT